MKLNFDDILEAFDFVSYAPVYEHEAYLCRQTGKIFCDSEFADNFEELPEDISDDEKYVVIPHKNELDLGSNLALGFAGKKFPERVDEVKEWMQQKGGFEKFTTLCGERGMLQAWKDFETQSIEQALRDWCLENKIDIS